MIAKQSLSKSDIKKVCDILRRDDGISAKDYVEQFSWLLFLKVFENVEAELKEIEEADGKKYKPVIDPEYKWSSWAKKDWKYKDELIYFVNKKLFPYLKSLRGSREKDIISEVFRELSSNRIRSAQNLLDVIDILDQIEMRHFQDTHLLSQVYEEILQEMGSEGGWSGEFYTPRPVIRLMVKIINPKLGERILDPFVGSAGFLIESFDSIKEQIKKLGVKEWKTLQEKTLYGQEKKPLPYLVGIMNMILHRILIPNLTCTNTLMEDIHNIPDSEKFNIILTNPPFGGRENNSVQNNFPIGVAATEALALQYVMKKLKNGGRCGIVLPEGQVMFGGGAFQRIREGLLKKFNVHTIISLPQGVFAAMGAGVKTNLIFFEKTGPTKEIWYGEVSGKFTKKKIIFDSHLEEIFRKWQKREISENTWITPIEEIKKRNSDISPRNPNRLVREKIPEPKELFECITQSQKEVENTINNIKKLLWGR